MSKLIVRAADRTAENEESFSHPFNPESKIHGHELSTPAGMKRVSVWKGRIPPGKESFAYHSHHVEEEWLYVLSGRAIVEIDDEMHELGPGDFVGFPAPGNAHIVKNPGPEDLVFLSGGERRDVEIGDFPRHGKRMVRVGTKVAIYDLDSGVPFSIFEKL
jgi:uncharacterized cupin superfamily protein